MSFFLPVTDRSGERACFLAPEALTPDLLARLGLSDGAVTTHILWGGSAHCVDLLLSAIADEAANRALNCLVCRSPHSPYPRTALWVEGVGILKSAVNPLPDPYDCRLIDLSPLSSLSDDEAVQVKALRAEIDTLSRECLALGKAAFLLEESALALTEPIHRVDLLEAKAARIAAKQPIGRGLRSIEVTTVDAEGKVIRALPFGGEVKLIGLCEQYSLAARFLKLLAEALDARRAEAILLTDRSSSATVGIWLPQSALCYLVDPPTERTHQMTLGCFLLPHSAPIRKRYRALTGCEKAIGSEIAARMGEIDTLERRIGELEEGALKKSRFGDFRKRLLIELFCR